MGANNISADSENLQKKTVTGVLWKFIERMSSQLVSLIVSVILARMLTPDDYSVVGIVSIFFAFANILVAGGFNSALIQKKEATVKDYSSILWISVIVAIVIYIAVFFCAPWIAGIYEKPLLIPIFRVMGIAIILNAVKAVLSAYVSSQLQFKKFFTSSIVSIVLSGVAGILMAHYGFGPWALVAQILVNTFVNTVALFLMTRIKFEFKIYFKECISLLKYGWKILAASTVSVIYDEIYPLIIGLKYSATDLSFYTKGKNFPHLINSAVSDTLSSVLFPVMAKMQDEKQEVLSYIRNFMRVASFFIFPIMIGFFIVSDNFVLVVLTEKWLPASIYIKAFCIAYMFNIINVGNLQAIQALGRSDLVLIMEVIKKVSYAVVVVLFLFFTNRPEFLAVAFIVNSFIALVVNSFPNRKLIGYKYHLQILDLLPNLVTSLVMGCVVYVVGNLIVNIYLKLIVQILVGAAVYFVLNIVIKNPSIKYFFTILKSFLKKGGKDDGVGKEVGA